MKVSINLPKDLLVETDDRVIAQRLKNPEQNVSRSSIIAKYLGIAYGKENCNGGEK